MLPTKFSALRITQQPVCYSRRICILRREFNQKIRLQQHTNALKVNERIRSTNFRNADISLFYVSEYAQLYLYIPFHD
jgi:homogentisate 1,2-dioxygenase